MNECQVGVKRASSKRRNLRGGSWKKNLWCPNIPDKREPERQAEFLGASIQNYGARESIAQWQWGLAHWTSSSGNPLGLLGKGGNSLQVSWVCPLASRRDRARRKSHTGQFLQDLQINSLIFFLTWPPASSTQAQQYSLCLVAYSKL